MRQFSDEELTAYLDGEADGPLSEAVSKALGEDTSVAKRLSQLEINTLEIKTAFDELLNVAPPAPETSFDAPVSSQPSSGWIKAAAALLLAVGVGFGVGSLNHSSELEEWQDYAAAYHKLYVSETLSNTGFSDETLASQLTKVSEAIGHDLTLEAIGSFASLSLKRSQTLGYEGGKIAHIALQDDKGNPIALCITKSGNVAPMSSEEIFGMQSVRWTSGTHSFYLVGGTDGELLKAAAKHFSTL